MPAVAPTATQFKADFPEFSEIDDAAVQAKLDTAERALDPDAFFDMYYDAVGWYAADLLVRSPFGQQMQLINEDGMTTYGEHFENILKYYTAKRGLLTGTDID